MPGKRSTLNSIIYLKCPRCREGDLFTTKNPYRLSRTLEMPNCCAVCKQDFRIEPGFYIGALWASYPIVVLLVLLIWLTAYLLLSLSGNSALVTGSIVAVLAQPMVMRLGRAIWISVFVEYRGE
jgi:hypothetical protein